MILVNIGNTRTSWTEVKKKRVGRIISYPSCNIDRYFIRKNFGNRDDKVILCSVVPKLSYMFKEYVKNLYVVGEDLLVPIKSLYNARQIGQDRLVNTFSAYKIYRQTRLVIDLGTAITFDFLSRNGVYEGGFIFPGIDLSFSILERCALLKGKSIFKNCIRNKGIPTNTVDSINKGIIESYVFMIKGFIDKYVGKNYLPEKVVVTGGGSRIIKKYLDLRVIYDEKLIFKGLYILGENND